MKKLLPIFLLLIVYTSSIAQDIDSYFNIWSTINLKADLKDNLLFHNELHVRRTNGFSSGQQFILRPSLHWRFAKGVSAAEATLTYEITRMSAAEEIMRPEHNIWIQLHPTQKLGEKFTLKHRYRWEGRWVRPVEVVVGGADQLKSATFVQRFRYRATLSYKLSDKWSASLFNEAFLNLRDNLSIEKFEQNWLYLGVGYKLSDQLSLGGGYMHQWFRASSAAYQRNPTLQLTLNIKL